MQCALCILWKIKTVIESFNHFQIVFNLFLYCLMSLNDTSPAQHGTSNSVPWITFAWKLFELRLNDDKLLLSVGWKDDENQPTNCYLWMILSANNNFDATTKIQKITTSAELWTCIVLYNKIMNDMAKYRILIYFSFLLLPDWFLWCRNHMMRISH